MTSSSATASADLRAALQARQDDAPLFSLVDADRSISSRTLVLQYGVTKRVWLHFVRLFSTRVGDVGNETHPSAARCDVGLLCQATFFATLAESACLSLGLVFCPFNPADPEKRRQRLMAQRAPRVVLRDADVELLAQQAIGAVDAGVPTPRVDTVVPLLPEAAVAYLMYTSGSTGEPKAITFIRENLHAYVVNFGHHPEGLHFCPASDTASPSRFLTLSTPFFDPSIGDMATTLWSASGEMVTLDHDALVDGRLAALLPLILPTHVVSTPAVWGQLPRVIAPELAARAGGRGGVRVFLGGEVVTDAIIDSWAGAVSLFNVYGLTEGTVYQSIQPIPAHSTAPLVTCGRGVGTDISIDATGYEGNAESGVGEVVLRGPQVAVGYADAGADGAPSPFGVCATTGERTFRTGDLGRWVPLTATAVTEPPTLLLRGRVDWQVKLQGQRVALEEVQQAMGAALGDCAVAVCSCAWRDMTRAEREAEGAAVQLGGGVVLRGWTIGHTPLPSPPPPPGVARALELLLELQLPGFMVPRHWLLLPEDTALPLTPTGKVDRQAVAKAIGDQAGRRCDASPGADTAAASASRHHDHDHDYHPALTARVRTAWEAALGIAVRPTTDYFAAGGDSLGALKLTRAVYVAANGGSDEGIDAYGLPPPPFRPQLLMRHPQLRAYVAAVAQGCRAAGLSLPGLAWDGAPGGDDAGSDPNTAQPTPPPAASEREWVLLDVVAAGIVPLAHALLSHHLCDVHSDRGGAAEKKSRRTTPLHAAARAADAAMVQALLSHGASTRAVTEDGISPAHLAALSPLPGAAATLRLLLAHGCPLHGRDGRQQSLLHCAARGGNVAVVRLLLEEHRMALETRDKWQRSAAHWAVLNGHTPVLAVMAAYVEEQTRWTAAPEEATPRQAGAKSYRAGSGQKRFERLARKKTHLPYESLEAMARRLHPSDEEMQRHCRLLSTVVGE